MRNVVYVGITYADRLQARISEHGDRFVKVAELELGQLTRFQARAVEQILIEHLPNLQNRINSISPTGRDYERAIQTGEEILQHFGFGF